MADVLPWYMQYRWIFLLTILGPWQICERIFRWITNTKIRIISPFQHQKDVLCVQTAVIKGNDSLDARKFTTDRKGTEAMALRLNVYKKDALQIPIRHLNSIIGTISSDNTLCVQPFVTIGQLTSYLLPLGYTLPVVPELEDLTVGGLIMGVGLESNSSQYGCFADNVTEIEFICPKGIRMILHPGDELFHAIPWSYGTLGFLVSARLKLRVAKKYVRVQYQKVQSHQDMSITMICETERSNFDHYEGIMYNSTEGVVVLGEEVNEVPVGSTVVHLDRWWAPWFYKHAHQHIQNGFHHIEYIPLRAFYHRHTRSIFWQMQELVPFGHQSWFRYLFGWLLPISVSTLKSTTPTCISQRYQSRFAFQDMLVPIEQIENALDITQDVTNIYPLWICPFKVTKYTDKTPFVAPVDGTEGLFVDIGIYGQLRGKDQNALRVIPKLESQVQALGGYQMLWAEVHQTKAQFESMFNHELYNHMRHKLYCGYRFPTVYDKVRFQP